MIPSPTLIAAMASLLKPGNAYRRYQEWKKTVVGAGDPAIDAFLEELPDDESRDRGLRRAVKTFAVYGGKGDLPTKAIEHSLSSGVVSVELATVLDELEVWVRAHFDHIAEDWRFVAKATIDYQPTPPQLLIGRLLVLVAKAEQVEQCEGKLWWATAMRQFCEKYVGAWPIALMWINGFLNEGAAAATKPVSGPGDSAIPSFLDFSAEWCAGGFNQLIVHQPLAAAFALTDVPPEMLQDLQVPWRAFRIQLPKSPISFLPKMWSGKGARAVVCQELWCWRSRVATISQGWMIAARAYVPEDPLDVAWWDLVPDSLPLDQLSRAKLGKLIVFEAPNEDEAETFRTVSFALLNIFLSAVLQLSAGHMERAATKKPPKGKRWRLPKQAPLTTDYVLGHDVKITGPNLAPVVTAMCRGERKFGRVQWVVRGHQRWQAHGPKHTLRKLIWVQPYWKGPVDAPILKRSYDLEPEVAGNEGDAVQ